MDCRNGSGLLHPMSWTDIYLPVSYSRHMSPAGSMYRVKMYVERCAWAAMGMGEPRRGSGVAEACVLRLQFEVDGAGDVMWI